MDTFLSTCSYSLIYVFRVNIPSHEGCLKIGMATVHTDKDADELPPGCDELDNAAKERIKEYSNTLGVVTDLLYTEIAVKEKLTKSGKIVRENFKDKNVHAVLEHSHICKKVFTGTTADEWYIVDLETVKMAIQAVKDGRPALSSKEGTVEEPPIQLREEQLEAVAKTLARFKEKNDMLWDAKMRFGKTLTALQLIKEAGFQKVAIITHRPVVNSGWGEDFSKIFRKSDTVAYTYVDKSALVESSYNAKDEKAKDEELAKLVHRQEHFIYFASIQDLRGSQRVGGKFKKNEGVFNLDWDLVIIDEAHEGTQTSLGDAVIKAITKKHTKVLALSGTPFNILGHYEAEAVYVWDYVMEQQRKVAWDKQYPGAPNPYADLPRLNIFTYSLGEEYQGYTQEDLEGKAFNFREFFRTWTGDEDQDGRKVPPGAEVGDFVHRNDVENFLDLISKDSSSSRYPFSTDENRALFRHTLWMVPGVSSAKALSALLKTHRVFGHYGIANVAGNGDDYEQEHFEDALKQVRKNISDNDYTITLSCGKLTTGVTVPEWTGVMMLSGSVNTSASSYMQTIFRVQSAGQIDGKQKENSYVFDFAPDRTLRVLAETVQISRRVAKNDADEGRARKALSEFLNYCPVISIEGTRMQLYDVPKMMSQLKHIFIVKAIKNGFDDTAIYSDKLLNLTEVDIQKFEALRGIVGESKQTKKADSVIVDDQGFDEEEHSRPYGGKKNSKELSEEEKQQRAQIKKQREQRKRAIAILRAISIRMPMLIYGADVPCEQDITLADFPKLVDDESWKEFMPNGVSKDTFAGFAEYYDADVFVSAGKEIRRLAKSADQLAPTERVKQIARIFSYFKNPDKETVLTPWRVVNMHLADTIGGWCFYDENFTEVCDEPRLVQIKGVTEKVFSKTDARILEINSKSGLYPIYVAYSLYRNAIGDVPETEINAAWRLKRWKQVVSHNLFVVCKTPMAESITRRTLLGYQTGQMNTMYFPNLVNTLRKEPHKFVEQVKTGKFWRNEEITVKQIEYEAVVGNPPYQEMDGGNNASAVPIYQHFVITAKMILPHYISMITPARWYAGGRDLDEYRKNMLNDSHLANLIDFVDANDCFPGVDISGGICYFLWNNKHNGLCSISNMRKGKCSTVKRFLNSYPILVRSNEAIGIIDKVLKQFGVTSVLSQYVGAQRPFGLRTFVRPSNKGKLILRWNQGKGHIEETKISTGKELINKWKVIVSRVFFEHGGNTDRNGQNRVLSILEILAPNEVCTETYIVVQAFETKDEADNLLRYLKTKFVRFLILQATSSIMITKNSFIFVPVQDFHETWNDEKLYKKYKLTTEERTTIEVAIRSME